MQIQFNTGVCTLLLVKVPDSASNIKIEFERLCFDFVADTLYPDYEMLPDGNWQFIGLSHELTEEQCKIIVFKMPWGNDCYKNYELIDKPQFVGINAKQSFDSLCRHMKIYNVNPVDSDQNILNMYSEWQEAQERTGSWAVLRLEE